MSSKTFALALAFIALSCSSIQPTQALFEEAIREAFEALRVRMCHPIPQLGLPALDPFQIKQAKISFDNKYLIDFKASVKDFNLTGLSDIIINDLKITTVPLRRSSFEVELPLTAFESLYTANGSLAYILNLAGDGGRAEAAIDTIKVSASWIFKTDIYLGIRSFKLQIKINDIYAKFENLFEEERINNFVYALINELGLELIDDIWQVENEFVEKLLEKIINKYIGNYTIADIVKILGGEGDPIFAEGPPGDCKDEKALEMRANLMKTVLSNKESNNLRKMIVKN